MQAVYLVHLSMDNKNVFNAVCRLLPGTISTDLCLVKDEDLQITILEDAPLPLL